MSDSDNGENMLRTRELCKELTRRCQDNGREETNFGITEVQLIEAVSKLKHRIDEIRLQIKSSRF